MMLRKFSRYAGLVALALLAVLVLSAFQPAPVHAAPLQPPLPGWLQDMLDQLEIALVKTLQDTARVGGVLFWGVLKVCGLVDFYADDFSTLFGTVITEALNAVITGSVHDLIRGSLMVSLSLLARPFRRRRLRRVARTQAGLLPARGHLGHRHPGLPAERAGHLHRARDLARRPL